MYIVCSGFELTNFLAGMARWQSTQGENQKQKPNRNQNESKPDKISLTIYSRTPAQILSHNT